MIPPQQIAIAAGLAGVVLGAPFGVYLWLTRGQRRVAREIRAGCGRRGWRYRVRRWEGNPAAFRIDGRTPGGFDWILTSGNTSGYDRGWCADLDWRVPALGGEADFAMLPRDGAGSAPAGQAIPPGMEAHVAAFSSALASEAAFFRTAQEFPSGLAGFDAAYRILALPGRLAQAPLDGALAERVIHWPADATAPHAVLAWREPSGFEIQARLPEPPNWAAVSHFVSLAADLSARLPAPQAPSSPATRFDRLLARIRRPL